MPYFCAILLQNVLISQNAGVQNTECKVWSAKCEAQNIGAQIVGNKVWKPKVWGAKYGGAKYGGKKWVNLLFQLEDRIISSNKIIWGTYS